MIWPSWCLNINVWKQFWGQNNPLSITTTTVGRLTKNEQLLMVMIKIVDKINKQGGQQNNERGRWSKTRLAAKNLFGGQFSKRATPVGRKGGHQQLETQIASCFDRMSGRRNYSGYFGMHFWHYALRYHQLKSVSSSFYLLLFFAFSTDTEFWQ